MRAEWSGARLFLLPLVAVIGTFALSAVPVSVASTPTFYSSGYVSGCGSDNSTGCTYWWSYSLWGNLYPGQTVYFDFSVYNTAPCGCSVQIDSLTIQTPWAKYTDPSLPQLIDTGYSYFNEFDISIPSNQSSGSVLGSLQFTGQFQDGTPWCSSTGDVCSQSANFTITADPTSLQQQVSSLKAQASTLSSQIASLNTMITTLTLQLSHANGNLTASVETIATDQAALSQAQSSLSTAESNLASTQSQLTSTNAQLTSEEADLASSQSSLNKSNDLYIPFAAVVPSAVAALLAVLYFKRKPLAHPAAAG